MAERRSRRRSQSSSGARSQSNSRQRARLWSQSRQRSGSRQYLYDPIGSEGHNHADILSQSAPQPVRKLPWSANVALRSLTWLYRRNASWKTSIVVVYLLACRLDLLCQSRIGWVISRISSYHAGSKSVCDIQPVDPLAQAFQSMGLYESILVEQPPSPISHHITYPVHDVVITMNELAKRAKRKASKGDSDFANAAELEQLTENVMKHADALFMLGSNLHTSEAATAVMGVMHSYEILTIRAKPIQESKLEQEDSAIPLFIRDFRTCYTFPDPQSLVSNTPRPPRARIP